MPEKNNLLKKQLHKDSVVNQVVKQITDSIIAGNLSRVINFLLSRSCVKILVLEEILCVKPLKFWKRMGWFT